MSGQERPSATVWHDLARAHIEVQAEAIVAQRGSQARQAGGRRRLSSSGRGRAGGRGRGGGSSDFLRTCTMPPRAILGVVCPFLDMVTWIGHNAHVSRRVRDGRC